MTVAAVAAVRPFSVGRALPLHASVSTGTIPARQITEVTAIRPADRLVIYQQRPDGRPQLMEFVFRPSGTRLNLVA